MALVDACPVLFADCASDDDDDTVDAVARLFFFADAASLDDDVDNMFSCFHMSACIACNPGTVISSLDDEYA